MNIERRFIFRGSAVPAGGWISRPREMVIEAGGASALTVSGGRSRGEVGRTRFGEFASFRSATTSAEGVFDDRKRARELTHGRLREDHLTTTTTVKAEVRELAVPGSPGLRIDHLRAALVGHSPGTSGEPSIGTRDLRIAGVDVGGHTLVVDLNHDLFEKFDTRSRLLAASEKPAFIREHGRSLLLARGPDGEPTRRALLQADGTIYGSVVAELRWKGKPYPGATIDGHTVKVPNFGRIFFGEVFVSRLSRRLTMVRLQLGSPVGGQMSFDEVETNGSWYPP